MTIRDKNIHQLNRESSCPPVMYYQRDRANDYIPPKITPEIAIDLFGEIARQPICYNLKLYCQKWQAKQAQIETLEFLIPSLPHIENVLSLRALYEFMLSRLQKELWQIESHLRRLQHSLELLEGKKIFRKHTDYTNHVDVESLKERLNIIGIIQQWVELRPSGDHFKGCCVFHNDRSPSFVVYPTSKRWWCFSCSEGGDIITFIQKIDNCTFQEAVTKLQDL